MSSTKATSVKYSVRPFFGFILRQNWQHLALYTILALLVMFVPCLLNFAEGIPDFHGYDTGEDYIRNMMRDLNKIAVVLSAGIGILAGMSAVGYVNSKSHVGCWHSFPVSRTKMYLIETGTRAIYYGIAILIGFVAAHILAAVFFGFGIPGMAGILFTGLLQAASYIGKYNLGYDVMHPTIDVGSLYNDINDTNRGLMYPAFGILYNYYKYEEKVDMGLEKYRYLKEAHEYNLPEGFINDFYIGFSDMLFAPSDADYPFIEKEGDSSTTWQVENFTAVNSGNAEKCDGYAKITLNGKAQIALTNGHYPPSVRNNVILKVKTTSDVNVTIQNEHTVNAPFVMGIIPDTNGEWKEISFPVLPQGVFRQRIFFLTFAGEGTIDVDYMKFTN